MAREEFLQVRLSTEMKKVLRKAAKAENRSMSNLIEKLIMEHIEKGKSK